MNDHTRLENLIYNGLDRIFTRLTAIEEKLDIKEEDKEIAEPCPCCEGDGIVIFTSGNKYYIQCNGCFLRTGILSSRKAAIEVWNRRPE